MTSIANSMSSVANKIWWGWKGLNLRPTGYEPAALTTELQPPELIFNYHIVSSPLYM